MGRNTPKPASSADPPGGWFYDKPLPYVLTDEGEAALDEAEGGTR